MFAWVVNSAQKLQKVLLCIQIKKYSGKLIKMTCAIYPGNCTKPDNCFFPVSMWVLGQCTLRIWCSWLFMSFPFSLALQLASWSHRFLCPTWMTWMNWLNTSASCFTSQPLWPASSFCWSCLVRTSIPVLLLNKRVQHKWKTKMTDAVFYETSTSKTSAL